MSRKSEGEQTSGRAQTRSPACRQERGHQRAPQWYAVADKKGPNLLMSPRGVCEGGTGGGGGGLEGGN